jgi:site-specific DNA recombinase
MKPVAPKKPFRCAIYTRKSTEHNLDLEFNSLDAQREACEAYIKSQAHEGWRLVPDRYDDGGLSGASLDRPALQALLADIAAGKIDIIVVYKVDRLTRSLADFAKLVELFDAQSVSFVSVTQSFNTTSSMGRLTLNVLLSFAQFEREVIGERVRDKIAASKRKGIWVGGSIPLGYACVDKKVVIVPEEADLVRLIFKRYLAVGSIGALAQDLGRRAIRTKRTTLSTGRVRGGVPFSTGGLAHLLHNRFYIGEVVYRGETHQGDFEPILDRRLFEAVQTSLASKAVARQARLKASPAILTRRLFDDRGNPMTPTHTAKRGVRYRYYVSHVVLQRRVRDAGSVTRVSAPEIEAAVINAVSSHVANVDADLPPGAGEGELVARYVERVVITRDELEVSVTASGHAQDHSQTTDERAAEDAGNATAVPVVIRIPWSSCTASAVKGIVHTPSADRRGSMKPGTRDALLTAIAKARSWIEDIVAGRVASLAEIAAREGRVERHIRLLAPLAFVSPGVLLEIADGSPSATLGVTSLATALPHSWSQQVGSFR